MFFLKIVMYFSWSLSYITTMKITNIDKATCQMLRTELNLALHDICKRYGVSIDVGRCTFGASHATFKVEVAAKNDDGKALNRDWTTLKAHQKLLGLSDDQLTKVFVLGGKKFQLAGYNTRKWAKPFILTCLDDGKTYVARKEHVKAALK